LILAGDRLIAGGEIDDAEARVPQGDAAVWGDPVPLPIRSAMVEALRGTLHGCCRHCITMRKKTRQFRTFGVPLIQLSWG
jgi:hypothetical protein